MAFNLPIPALPSRRIATPPFMLPPPMPPGVVPPPPEIGQSQPDLGVPRMAPPQIGSAPPPLPPMERPPVPELPKPKEVGGVRKAIGTALQVAGIGPLGRGLSYGFDYGEKLRQYGLEQEARKQQSEIAENEAQTEANREHANYFRAQAGAKEAPPLTYRDRFEQAKAAGASDEQAHAFAAQGHNPVALKPPDLPNTYEQHLTRQLYDKDPAVRKDAQEELDILKRRDSGGGIQDILLNPDKYTPEQYKRADQMWKEMHPMGSGNEPIYPVFKNGQVVYARRSDAVGQPAPRTLYGPDGTSSVGGQAGFSTTAPPTIPAEAQKQLGDMLNARALFSDVDKMLQSKKYTTLGPALGRVKLAEIEKLGGFGATKEEIELATRLRILLRTQAFAKGGQQLTGTEKEEFIATTPSMNDTVLAAWTKTQEGMRILDREMRNRLSVMTPRQLGQLPPDVREVGRGSGAPSPGSQRMRKGNRVEWIKGDKVKEATDRGWKPAQ